MARVAQDAVLTPIPPTSGALRLASAYESASREALIGGDLFAVVSTGRETRLLVGDVRGKGLDAVKTAATVLALFRESATQSATLRELAAHCDGRLQPHLGDEDFVTALFASIDEDGRVELVSHGHPAPVLTQGSDRHGPRDPRARRAARARAATPTSRLPLRLQLDPGDRLLFFTDGLAEARDRDGNFLDLRELVIGVGSGAFDEALPGVLARLHTAADHIDDDLALLLVEYGVPGGAEPAVTSGTFTSVASGA